MDEGRRRAESDEHVDGEGGVRDRMLRVRCVKTCADGSGPFVHFDHLAHDLGATETRRSVQPLTPAHRNGIKRVATQRYKSLKGVDPKVCTGRRVWEYVLTSALLVRLRSIFPSYPSISRLPLVLRLYRYSLLEPPPLALLPHLQPPSTPIASPPPASLSHSLLLVFASLRPPVPPQRQVRCPGHPEGRCRRQEGVGISVCSVAVYHHFTG